MFLNNFLSKIFLCFFVVSSLLLVGKIAFAETTNGSSEKPKNIIYIMLDDAGYYDFGYNAEKLPNGDAITPNIDALRANGIAFDQFYSGAAICSPTRVSVLTGNTPLRYGAVDAWPQIDEIDQAGSGMSGLSRNIPQLGNIMKDLNMSTGHFGKWHVGLNRPQYAHRALGFEKYAYHQKLPENPIKKFGNFEFNVNGEKSIVDVDHIDEFFVERANEFIVDKVRRNQNFYMNYWPLTPHSDFDPPRDFDYSKIGVDPDFLNDSNLTTDEKDRIRVVAMMYAIDEMIGTMIDTLETEGVLDDTLIIITSDNGNIERVKSGPFRGGKGTLFEGGIRMPMVAHWPNGIAPNTTSNSVMNTYDLMPTFIDFLGGNPEVLYSQIDGRSKMDSFVLQDNSGNMIEQDHEPLYWHMSGVPDRRDDERAQTTYALRDGKYKIVKPENRNPLTDRFPYFFFDLEADPNEEIRLDYSHPMFESMRDQLIQARLDNSKYTDFPSSASQVKILNFDPRLDVTSKDMTLVMNITVPENLDSQRNIYYKPGSQRITLLKDSTIRWRITGAKPGKGGTPVSAILESDVLTPGNHEIAFIIGGFKKDNARIEMYIDGVKVDEIDKPDALNEHKTIWSATSDAILGDYNLNLYDIRYHTIRLWSDEW